MDTGMELPTIIDAFRSPKNSQMMTMEMIMASTIVSITELRDDMMESLVIIYYGNLQAWILGGKALIHHPLYIF